MNNLQEKLKLSHVISDMCFVLDDYNEFKNDLTSIKIETKEHADLIRTSISLIEKGVEKMKKVYNILSEIEDDITDKNAI